MLEALGVTLSKNARCRALQLPTWNEALGLPRPWDQQWSLRIQQVLAYETDLLEYADLFDGSPVIEAQAAALRRARRGPSSRSVLEQGGAVAAVESGYMKQRWSSRTRGALAASRAGEQTVVGVNSARRPRRSPLAWPAGDFLEVDAAAEREQIERLRGVPRAAQPAAATRRAAQPAGRARAAPT